MDNQINGFIDTISQLEAENENLKFRLSLVSGQSFCSYAEKFVRWLDDESLDSFYKGNELFYYWTERAGEDIPADVVLARFVKEQKDCR